LGPPSKAGGIPKQQEQLPTHHQKVGFITNGSVSILPSCDCSCIPLTKTAERSIIVGFLWRLQLDEGLPHRREFAVGLPPLAQPALAKSWKLPPGMKNRRSKPVPPPRRRPGRNPQPRAATPRPVPSDAERRAPNRCTSRRSKIPCQFRGGGRTAPTAVAAGHGAGCRIARIV
jgi:hypothetical protein